MDSWTHIIQPYTKSAQIFVCPSAQPRFTPDPKFFTSTKSYTGATTTEAAQAAGKAWGGDGTNVAFSQIPSLSYGRNLVNNTIISGSPGNMSFGWSSGSFTAADLPKHGMVNPTTFLLD